MITHLSKYVQYQCEKFDFNGGDVYILEVHVLKHHGDKFEYGQWFLLRKIKKCYIEIHIATWESYFFTICKTKFANSPDDKTQFIN